MISSRTQVFVRTSLLAQLSPTELGSICNRRCLRRPNRSAFVNEQATWTIYHGGYGTKGNVLSRFWRGAHSTVIAGRSGGFCCLAVRFVWLTLAQKLLAQPNQRRPIQFPAFHEVASQRMKGFSCFFRIHQVQPLAVIV